MKLRRSHLIAALALLLLCAAAFLLFSRDAGQSQRGGIVTAAATAEDIERGKYLATAGNCYSCHTSVGKAAYAGGVAFETPFGTLYSSNITPDNATGIGAWTADDLRRAMHAGVSADGSPLFPAFPYPSYTKVTDADVVAIYAYLRTLTPVKAEPPQNSFLLRQRWALRVWQALFFEEGRFVPDSKQSEEWNRGAYLVDGLAHCGACHTPRNRFMAEVTERAYEGGVLQHRVTDDKVRAWSAVNLTQAKTALGPWSVSDLKKYLATGVSRRAGTFGPMNEVIVNSISKLTAEDVGAMAVYLKSLPAKDPVAATTLAAATEQAAAIYTDRCEDCHGSSGRGGTFTGPPLAGSAIVQAANPASLLNVIIHGPEMPEDVSFGGWETMKPYGDVLDDAEIAAVSNYVRSSWGNVAGAVTADDVAQQR